MKYKDLKELLEKGRGFIFLAFIFLAFYLQSFLVGFIAFFFASLVADEDKCPICDFLKEKTNFIKD